MSKVIITLHDDGGEIMCNAEFEGGYDEGNHVHACANMAIGVMTELCTQQPVDQPAPPDPAALEAALSGMRKAAEAKMLEAVGSEG